LDLAKLFYEKSKKGKIIADLFDFLNLIVWNDVM